MLLPLAGFIFLPLTTLTYAWMMNNHMPVDGVNLPYAETGGMLEDLQPRSCEQLYKAMVTTCAVDTTLAG